MKATYNGPARPGWEPGVTYWCSSQAMSGRIYKSLADKKGKPDTRVMIWQDNGPSNLICVEKEEIKTLFSEAY